MDYGRLAKEYRSSAERLKEREEQLAGRPRAGERVERLRVQERLTELRAEYWQLAEVADYLERCEREAR